MKRKLTWVLLTLIVSIISLLAIPPSQAVRSPENATEPRGDNSISRDEQLNTGMKGWSFLRPDFFVTRDSSPRAPLPFVASTYSWNVNSLGNWNDNTKWTLNAGPGNASGFPDAVDDIATFPSIITAQRGIAIPAGVTITVGTINLQDNDRAYLLGNPSTATGTIVFDVSAGSAAINVTGGAAQNSNEAIVILNDSLVIDSAAGTNFRIFGPIGESGGAKGITKTGTGTVDFRPIPAVPGGAHTYTGTTTINNGFLFVTGTVTSSPFSLTSGTLSGDGTTGPLTATGGTVAPGPNPAPGTTTGVLNVMGDVSLSAPAIFAAELKGLTLGTEYDQLNVTGGVSLGGSTLTVTIDPAFTPMLGNTFTIINNDAADAVTGRFAGLPNSGNTFVVGATTFSINYAGGDGNDVVLTVAPPAAPVTVTATAGTLGPTDYTTLKAAFDAVNSGTHQGVVTVTINASTTEAAAAVLNASGTGSSSYTSLNVHPSAAGLSVTGSIAGDAVIVLNGADSVTIDGSVSGGSTGGVGGNPAIRNLTVQNTSTTGTGVIALNSGTSGAQDDTIKNVIVLGQDPAQTTVGIGIGGAPAGINPPTVSNNNVRVENCSIQRALFGIIDHGLSNAGAATGNVITRNDITGTGTNRIQRIGIDLLNQNGIQITENSIGGIGAGENTDVIGIDAGVTNVTSANSSPGGITNSLISRNKINGIATTGTSSNSAVGIAIAGDTGGENFVQNNMITGVTAPSTGSDLVAGIFVAGAVNSNTHVFYNSISNTGARGATASQVGSFAIAITGSNPVVELKDNIFYNTQTSAGGANAKSYAIGMETSTFTLLSSDFNDFFTSGANAAGFRTGGLNTAGAGTDIANLAAWKAATSQDASSLAVDPLFVNPLTDLHLQAASTVKDVGVAIVAVTNDFDNDIRPQGAGVDIGADELVGAPVFGPTDFLVADFAFGKIAIFDQNLVFKGNLDASIGGAYGLDFLPNGNVVATGRNAQQIKIYDSSGAVVGGFSGNANVNTNSQDLKASSSNLLYLGPGTGVIAELNLTGTKSRGFGNVGANYSGVALLPSNKMWGYGIGTTVDVFDLSSGIGNNIAPTSSFTLDNGQGNAISMFFSSATTTVLMTDNGGDVYERNTMGAFVRKFLMSSAPPGTYVARSGVTRGPGGDVYVTTSLGGVPGSDARIVRFNGTTGAFISSTDVSANLASPCNIIWAGNISSGAPAPDLTITKTHAGNFMQGSTGNNYTVTVTNSGTADKDAGQSVSVTDAPPPGLTVTAMSGTGWTCTTLPTCTRSDVLAPTNSYEPITVTVSVACNAASPRVNSITVTTAQTESNSGNNTVNDSTTITPGGGPPLTITCPGGITKFTDPGQLGVTINPGTPVTSGGCAPVTVTGTRSDGKPLNALYPVGMTLITWTATDANGATATCSQSIAVMVPSSPRRIPPR